ncbi:unnamed protein product [Nippostrongylus brasiliensis]|uniref:ZT_dimer domain-containing protein n=1 Tax=Nippostrongylus brasiliensis TaxID=27835 RepID=A0A0N4YYX6_NIPBR|nr:unnamed protein product [Nippostrongylus brasiliensis]
MDREISLCEAHDVSETLQAKLEQLSFVERAFVHCDYMFDGDEHIIPNECKESSGIKPTNSHDLSTTKDRFAQFQSCSLASEVSRKPS